MDQRFSQKQLWLPEPEAFWNRVSKNGPLVEKRVGRCWQWEGTRSGSGYGVVKPTTVEMRKTHAQLMAHRVAWELEHGPIPDGKLICHHCDNRACVRPSHLFLGDDQANSDDKWEKGRGRVPPKAFNHAKGEKQHLAKLTEDAVRDIRRARAKAPPTPLKELAERHGVSLVAVSCVALGKTWRHVK